MFKSRTDYVSENNKTDLVQKTAWRLVRSAEDRFGQLKGTEKREWAIKRLMETFQNLIHIDAEDHIRSAYFNMSIEMGVLERR